MEDTKIPNAATIKVLKQDHTLGNMIRAYVLLQLYSYLLVSLNLLIRSQLLQSPQVLFAGYKVPHPLHPYFLIKLQTDGTITPAYALEQACTKLIGTLASLETQFKREFSYKDVQGGADGAAAGGAGGFGGGLGGYGMGEEVDAYGGGAGGGQGQGWAAGRDYLDL